ncbi:MAG: NAD(P)H-dependent oxidoreductase [Crocinitomicaceae bacterium]|nr:NAD(P)H-dependent oxidoreductase [Crocinitomicaceae bacterium]MDG1659614.1 NAD(P)H-dependent oxidoreductase [Crocinitomicaceae bacterium]MDG2440071.1 NAD(P)H-dependent oxidoreductase [Crocinitomicaceae bacterium]|tara:strand:- start:2831 stop:3361 length:531 start_codon:yes stop_codon:yes gene_type:complete
MKSILAIGASSSRTSINRKLASYTANQVADCMVELLDLNDFEMPIYSVDKEEELGIPNEALKFKKQIQDADGIIISFAEHNGSYAAAYKNIVDWTSRIEGKLWEEKTLFLMATSPGDRGGQTVLASATSSYPRMGANVVSEFSLPSFYENFSDEGINDETLKSAFETQLSKYIQNI